MSAFHSAFARLRSTVEQACAAEGRWPKQVAEGIEAALAFAAADPAAAQTLTNDAMARRSAGFLSYERLVTYFTAKLHPGRKLRPEGQRLPDSTERAMVSGVAMLVAQRLNERREDELLSAAPEVVQFVLTPYVGAEEAKRVARAATRPSR